MRYWQTEGVGRSRSLDTIVTIPPLPRLAALRRVWPLALALLVIAVMVAGFNCSRHGRAAAVSAMFLSDTLLDLPVRPITWFTADPVVERKFIDYGSGRIMADIYRPADDDRHGAIIFSMGAPPLDLDDPRLVRLAEDAARVGLVMVLPFSERLDAEVIETEEVDALVGIFEFLEEQPYVDPERIGYIGVSVGGSLALLAAADERIAERVDYLISFGGYFNAVDLMAAVGSGSIIYNGQAEEWEPDSHTVRVLARQVIKELRNADDRAILTRTFVDQEPVVASDLAELSTEGLAAYELLTSGDPVRSRELLSRLPPALEDNLDQLSPDGVIDGLEADIFIIHDRSDAFIPYVESRRMRDALAGREEVHFTEVSLFEHVEPRLNQRGDIIVVDVTRLYHRLFQLLLRLL